MMDVRPVGGGGETHTVAADLARNLKSQIFPVQYRRLNN